MSSPHAYLLQIFSENLPAKDWIIRNGDRPIDALTTRRCIVAYTSSIEPKRTLSPSTVRADITLIVFGRNTSADNVEDELFQALTQVIGVLNEKDKTLTWSEARRGVWNDMPGYQLEAQLFYTIEQQTDEEE